MRYSVIIPRLQSSRWGGWIAAKSQLYSVLKILNVVIVEDGSSIPCKEVADRYTDRLDIKYFSKPNSGPGADP